MHPVFHQVAIKILDWSEKNNGNYTDKNNCLSRAGLLAASVFYYKKHKLHKEGATAKGKEEEEKILKTRLRKWMKGKYLEGMDDTDEVAKNVDPIDFFLPHMIEHRPFIRLAIFILSCPVQSASCECLFKDFAFLHTKARNRLSEPIRKRLTMIKHDMIRKYGNDDVQNNRKQKSSKNRMVVSREYNRLDAIVEDDNEEESDEDGEGVDRGDSAAAALLDLLVDEEVDDSRYEGESEEGITTGGGIVDEIEEAADLHVEGHTGTAALSLWRRALESVIPEDDNFSTIIETQQEGVAMPQLKEPAAENWTMINLNMMNPQLLIHKL